MILSKQDSLLYIAAVSYIISKHDLIIEKCYRNQPIANKSKPAQCCLKWLCIWTRWSDIHTGV